MPNSGPFSLFTRALIPILLGVFGLAYTVQERQAEEFELLVSLLTDEASQRREAGDSLWVRYSLRCDELFERVTLQCRLGEEYREIIAGLAADARSANLKDYELQPARQRMIMVADVENEAVGALSGNNPFDLLSDDDVEISRDVSRERFAAPGEAVRTGSGEDAAASGRAYSDQTALLTQEPVSRIVRQLEPLVYVHIPPNVDRDMVRRFELALEQYSVNGRPIVVPGIQLVNQTPDETQLRYLKAFDRQEAFELADYLRKLGCAVADPISLAHRYNEDKRVRPRTYELWFSADAETSCLTDFANRTMN